MAPVDAGSKYSGKSALYDLRLALSAFGVPGLRGLAFGLRLKTQKATTFLFGDGLQLRILFKLTITPRA
jgi:hypothetical protein